MRNSIYTCRIVKKAKIFLSYVKQFWILLQFWTLSGVKKS